MRGSGDSDKKLFVGGLNYDTEDKDLKAYFERFGPLSDYVVMRFSDGTRRSRGFGFVTFERADDMEHCISSQPHTIDARTIELKRATPREEGASRGGSFGAAGGTKRRWNDDSEEAVDPEGKLMRKLFIGGLSYSTTEEGMKTYFEKFGRLDDAVIMKFPDSGRSRGFGFITFEKAYMVDDCQRSRPHEIDGKVVECKRATPKSEAKKPEAQASVKKLYVGNLTEEMSDEDLKDYFSKFGVVNNIEQMKWNDTGKKRGFGFVEFDDYDAVDKICLLNKHFLLGKRLEVRKALSKQEMSIIKKAKMSEEWNKGGHGGQMDSFGGGNMGNMGGGGMGGGMGNMGSGMGNMGSGMGNMGSGLGGMGGGMSNMGGGSGMMNPQMQQMQQMMSNMSNMNPMMMMTMMMNMMNGGNMAGGGATETKSYSTEAKKEAKPERGFGTSASQQPATYSSTGYSSGTYGNSGYGAYDTSAAGATGGGNMDMMSNMANMMGMNNWSGMGATGGWGDTSARSTGGGPIRGSSGRETSAPYRR